jgi:arylsulfate sulfotransferase
VSKYPLSKKYSRYAYASLLLILFAGGCGGGYTAPPKTPPPPVPSVLLSSSSITFPATNQGLSSTPMMVTVTNSGTAALTISSVAAGGSNPGDFTNTNTCTAAINAMGTCSISVTFVPTVPGPRSETITLTDNASGSPQIINVTGTANPPIAVTVAPPTSAIGTSQAVTFTSSGDPAGVTWSLAGFTNSAMGTAAPAGTIDASGNYNPPPGSPSFFAVVTATSKTDPTKSSTATVNVVAPGLSAPTNNVQVAQYTISPAAPANVSVQFGLDTTYGLTTWTQPAPATGGPVSLFVAGMKASTLYHLRGVVAFADGSQFLDADQTFTTGALTVGTIPNIAATTTPGMTPQRGVELLDLVNVGVATTQFPVAVTDLSGNVLWAYNPTLDAGVLANPIKLLPNGHFLINFGKASPDGGDSMIQEVDLGGNVIWQMTAAQLNTALAAATCTGCNITVVGTHHDFVMLPNGHLIVIASTQQAVSGTTVTGDVLIDLGDMDNAGGNNPNHTPLPVWLWNEFDHLDITRQPYMYPDWTHTNAILYSQSDGNLIISIRHQNWVIKIDYNNGAGAGDILWHLGYQGDFTLLNADGTADTNPFDWFYAQHGPSFTTTNTSGMFSMVLFDNGDDRGVSVVAGGTCGVTGQPACYSTVPLLNLDETAKTATLAFHPTTQDYSFFGGNAEVLQDSNVEYDECASAPSPTNSAAIFEVTQTSPPQTVWQMNIAGQYAYRGLRLPSLYPGVQW